MGITPLFVYLYTDFWTNKISLISHRFESLWIKVQKVKQPDSSTTFRQDCQSWRYRSNDKFSSKTEKKMEKREKSVRCLGGRSFEFHNVPVKNFEKWQFNNFNRIEWGVLNDPEIFKPQYLSSKCEKNV